MNKTNIKNFAIWARNMTPHGTSSDTHSCARSQAFQMPTPHGKLNASNASSSSKRTKKN